jgi:hypothetical protein
MSTDLDDPPNPSIGKSTAEHPEPFPLGRFLLWVACGIIDLALATAFVWWLWD